MEVASATWPATNTPTGTVPPKAIIQIAITRPRTSSDKWAWSMVDSDVTTAKYDTPTANTTGYARAGSRASANTESKTPNDASPTRTINGFDRRTSTVPIDSAPNAAPKANAANRSPYARLRVFIPRLSDANVGIR